MIFHMAALCILFTIYGLCVLAGLWEREKGRE